MKNRNVIFFLVIILTALWTVAPVSGQTPSGTESEQPSASIPMVRALEEGLIKEVEIKGGEKQSG